jgi:hypothetical protein
MSQMDCAFSKLRRTLFDQGSGPNTFWPAAQHGSEKAEI